MKHNSVAGARVAVAALLLVAGAACSDEESPGQGTPSPSSSSSAPQPSQTPTESEAASAAAISAVRSYYELRDRLRREPRTPLSQLKQVTISGELTAQRALFRRERERGWRQVGATRLHTVRVEAVDLAGGDPESGDVPSVRVDVCYDVASVDVLDAEGNSIVAAGRPDTGWIRYTVANYKYADEPDRGWRVASSENLERKPCDAS